MKKVFRSFPTRRILAVILHVCSTDAHVLLDLNIQIKARTGIFGSDLVKLL